MAGGLVGEVLRVWWQDAAELYRQLGVIPVPTRREWYRLGDGYLEIRSDDDPFRERLELLFRECVVPAPAEDGFPRVRCTVRAPAGERHLKVRPA